MDRIRLGVVSQLEGVGERGGDAVYLVDASDGFFGVPGGAHFSVGVTGVQEATEPCLATVADAFGCGGEEPPYPIQRIAFSASVPEGFVLDPAPDFVEPLVSQPDDMERVCDL